MAQSISTHIYIYLLNRFLFYFIKNLPTLSFQHFFISHCFYFTNQFNYYFWLLNLLHYILIIDKLLFSILEFYQCDLPYVLLDLIARIILLRNPFRNTKLICGFYWVYCFLLVQREFRNNLLIYLFKKGNH